jgi:transposase-like protein
MSAHKTETTVLSQDRAFEERFDATGFDVRLTSRQEAAVNLLAIGYTSRDVSSVLRISRSTVNFWNKHLPRFKAQLEELQEQLAEDKNGTNGTRSRRD